MDDTLPRLRRTILETSHRAKEGHIASAFSILEIVWTLYDRVMWLPLTPGTEQDDRFILSKGHGCLALYAVLAEKGYDIDLATFSQPGSPLEGHPHRGIPGVEASTGSLGHGLPMAVGMAYALKLQRNPARVFVLVGDTEMEEGSCWEALHLAARHRLDNLVCIVDANGTSPNRIDGYEDFVDDLGAKFKAFGWDVWRVDGHDCNKIELACNREGEIDTPRVIIANTVKGKGVPAMEADPQAWHRRSPTDAEMPGLLATIG